MDFIAWLGILIYSFLGVLILGGIYAIWLILDILPKTSSGTQGKRASKSAVNHLERQLLSMVGGDRAVATRLLLNIRFKHPQKSKNWCYEKVIYDLQRDRRSI
ncbi:hypothetical protein V0288_19705 [Pannus brasiliensis CCIBt3594]|uniref:ATP synthase F0 subunit 8 n=1 Tax=Pannus brasiliensis CCIBt3594 TaxID=1427578 RepID=A0AAW9QXL5_9CHRO